MTRIRPRAAEVALWDALNLNDLVVIKGGQCVNVGDYVEK
jgi:hypothetical protein